MEQESDSLNERKGELPLLMGFMNMELNSMKPIKRGKIHLSAGIQGWTFEKYKPDYSKVETFNIVIKYER